MSFPRKLLTPGEVLVSESHPNWSVLVRPVLLTVVAIAACVAILVAFGSLPIAVGYLLLAVAVLAFVYLASKVVAWQSATLVITTTRVVYRFGVLRRTGREIPLDRVQDVTYHQSILERLVGAGNLTIESAGASGQEPFPDIRHPAAMQSLINRLMSERDGGVGAPSRVASRPAPAAAPAEWGRESRGEPTGQYEAVGSSLADQLRHLEELHDHGVLTDGEFDRQRRGLLGT